MHDDGLETEVCHSMRRHILAKQRGAMSPSNSVESSEDDTEDGDDKDEELVDTDDAVKQFNDSTSGE